MREVHITSLIVQVHPATVAEVAEQLNAQPEMEVAHVEAATGKIIAVIEADSLRNIEQYINCINEINGVVFTTMVYQHSESDSALDEVLA